MQFVPYTGFLRWKWWNKLAVLARVERWLKLLTSRVVWGVDDVISGRGTGKAKTAGQ
jgi:hypothetical protein